MSEQRKSSIAWPFIFVAFTIALIIVFTWVSYRDRPAEDSTDEYKEELEERVNDILAGDGQFQRENAPDIFLLADIYAEEGNDKEAIRLYEKGLEIDERQLGYQLQLARLLHKSGDVKKAANKATVVALYAEDKALLAEAQKFLSETAGKSFTLPSGKGRGEYLETVEIVIVPIGAINKRLVHEFKDAIQSKMGIKYSIAEVQLDPGKAARRGQYDADLLQDLLGTNFSLGERHGVRGYLGITEVDIYARDYNYLFGWAGKGYGVISYRRFTARFDREAPNRPRLLRRTLKQGISSSFFILGIPRCKTPDCARAYPGNLEEHDRKGTEICEWCRGQLKAYIESNP